MTTPTTNAERLADRLDVIRATTVLPAHHHDWLRDSSAELRRLAELERDNAALLRQWNELDQRNEKRHREWAEQLAAANERAEKAESQLHTCPKCGENCKECDCMQKQLDEAVGLLKEWYWIYVSGEPTEFFNLRDRTGLSLSRLDQP